LVGYIAPIRYILTITSDIFKRFLTLLAEPTAHNIEHTTKIQYFRANWPIRTNIFIKNITLRKRACRPLPLLASHHLKQAAKKTYV
jgi:hypothetical protein